MGLFKRRNDQPITSEGSASVSRRTWAGGTAALARSVNLSDPTVLAALEAQCGDGETVMGVVDGRRLYLSGMRQVEGTIVLTDVRLIFIDVSGKRPKADSLPVSGIRELGARSGFFEVVIASGPSDDYNTWWLHIGPEEHLAPFAALIMSSPNYTGDR